MIKVYAMMACSLAFVAEAYIINGKVDTRG